MLRVHKLKRGDEWPYSETAAAAKSASRVNVMVWAILEKISRSDTARTIIEALRKSDHIFDIIPLRGQGGGFFLPSCDSFPEIHRQGASGCIVWYPEATFEYYTRGPRGSVQSGIRPGWTLFAARSDLVLIHELGHALQLIGDEYRGDGNKFMEDYGKDMERIEHANIDQHEAPVAVDMGYPARTYYHHAKDSDWSVKFLRTT